MTGTLRINSTANITPRPEIVDARARLATLKAAADAYLKKWSPSKTTTDAWLASYESIFRFLERRVRHVLSLTTTPPSALPFGADRRQPIRLHDLRASFVTTSLANGRNEQWVTDRTGHRSSQMVALYSRQAREWAELELGPFRALDALLPEMAAERAPSDDGAAAAEALPTAPDWAAIGRRMVGRAGHDPATYGLKVRSSTD